MARYFGMFLIALMTALPVIQSCSTTERLRPKTTNEPGVHIELNESQGLADVYINGTQVTSYRFDEERRVPILWPVFGEGGLTMTRNWPMGEDDPEITDHPHHHSLWTAFGDVNGYDQWHRQRIVTEQVISRSGDEFGVIVSWNHWLDDEGNPIVNEMREYRFFNAPLSGWYFDQTVTFDAAYGDVTFGDDKEGLFAFRIRTEIQGNRNGILTNSHGQQTEREVYGTPAEWMDYSGPVEGIGNRGIALMSHPDNMRLPAWHVRNYGLVGCNFFALKNVAGMDQEGTYVLPAGERLTFHVRYYIHSGDVNEADVAGHYAEFARTLFPSN